MEEVEESRVSQVTKEISNQVPSRETSLHEPKTGDSTEYRNNQNVNRMKKVNF